MKAKIFKRISLTLALALIAAQLLMLTVFATEEPEWEMSVNGNFLYYGENAYEYYDADYTLYPIPKEIYGFDQQLFYGGTIEKSNVSENGIVWVDFGGIDFYATKDAKSKLDAFMKGDIGGFLLSNENDVYFNAVLEETTAESIITAYDGGFKTRRVSVKDLENVETYHVLAIDKSETLAYIYGAIYLVGAEYCFVDYTKLGNQYFDADGNFSYRSGTVEVEALSADLASEVRKTINSIEDNYPTYVWEDSVNDPYDMDIFWDEASAIVAFWVCYVLAGFILPIPFIIVGLVFPRSRKKGYPKYWYILSMIAGLWLVLAAVLLAVILMI